MAKKKKNNRYVDPAILEQIDIAKSGMEDDPDFNLVRRFRAYQNLRSEAGRHSVEIELPNGKKIRRGRARKIAEENLMIAQAYFSKNYRGNLSDELIMNCSELIDPKLAPASYRGINSPTVRSQGENTFIYPRNVPDQMENFLTENNSVSNNVEKAVHSHLHIARIHPFFDGNGRLARLIQNGILESADFPPIKINRFDRAEYLNLIGEAARSYREERELRPEQKKFYNYLALKLRDSLNETRKEISK